MTQTATQKPEIKSTAIYKIIGQNCYAVPSDTTNAMYKVCFDNDASNWTCTCRHGEIMSEHGHAAHCKHVAAVQISILANKKKPLETSVKGTLNGSSQGFSLMR